MCQWYKFISLIFLATILCTKKGEGKQSLRLSASVPVSSTLSDQLLHTVPFIDELFNNDSATCVLPFTKAGNLILVKAKADTMEGNFILDTGAPHLVLNITYFRDYPATLVQDTEQSSITGTASMVSRTKVRGFTLGTLEYSQVEADLVNLGHIENSKGVRILGLLGVELFKQCEMIIDYENSVIYLHRIARKESATYASMLLSDVSAYRTFPIELMENRIVVASVVEGKKLRFVIDCAAESNVLDSRLPNKILDNVTITRRVQLTGSGSRKVEALYGDLSNLKIGDYDFNNLPVVVTNLENTCFSYMGCISGVLGFDFLSLQKIGFNFVNRKMYIWK